MAKSQKFIERNRAPLKIEIAYDIETFNGPKRVELPFIMGVMADLSGKPEESAGALDRPEIQRYIDMEYFDDTLKYLLAQAARRFPMKSQTH